MHISYLTDSDDHKTMDFNLKLEPFCNLEDPHKVIEIAMQMLLQKEPEGIKQWSGWYV